MRILVTTRSDTYALEVSEDLELENFKVLCGAESGMETSEIVVAFNGRKLTEDKKSLKDYGIKDGDMIMAMPDASVLQSAVDMMQQASAPRNPPAPSDIIQFDFGSIQVPGLGTPPSSAPATTPRSSVMPSVPGQAGNPETSNANSTVSPGQDPERSPAVQDDLGLGESAGNQDDPAVIRDMLLANPEQLALLKHNNPKLAEALTSGDLDRFALVLREQQDARKDRERQRIRLLSADPFDMEAQRMIADEIQQENINANMEAAMEFNPESFGTVHMLYINCLVNGHPVKAFIDSGAQTTIMSQSCAERCNIMRLVDNRWAGIAKGVGTQRIIGRVHMGQIQIGGDFLASSFSILEDQPMDMLLGLDMLKRHQMCIDLKENHLLIGTTSSRTPFLHESELPACARLTAHSEEDALKQSERAARQHEEQALAKALADSAMEHSGPSNAPAPPTAATPTSPTPTAATPSAARTPTAPTFPERDIEELMAIGFSRAEVLLELQRQRGNKTQAMAALFAKSFKMGP